MKLVRPITIEEIQHIFSLTIIQAPHSIKSISGINEINKIEEGDLTFVDHIKYYDTALQSKAKMIIINTQDYHFPENKIIAYHPNPFLAYNTIGKTLKAMQFPEEETHLDIHPSAKIAPNVSIGNYVYIGKNTIIHPNVTIYDHVFIGDNVIIHANTVIGKDAFYYNKQGDTYAKMETLGNTIIEDEVEIGSNCSVDAGVSGTTIVGRGTKVDNLVHIGHGVVIGQNCLLCAQVAIAGKTKIGNQVILYGKVGVSKCLEIGDNAIILASSNVDKSLEGNKKYFGSPAQESMKEFRIQAALRFLPKLMEEFKILQKNFM
ncbi:MAG: UDP-3-O-(3-hydroxymyristoyl)glucosamine N-acyltransferase [Chitinophagales bacterium]|jgi:UDP-3-O-[3-hydroxymyristoyl] glucosamine N-acyltransferase|nr:UDP-3-O-(3-hydroxymyristoyl)glucosamine N-acyltransferase [Chitinophagales bacterium]